MVDISHLVCYKKKAYIYVGVPCFVIPKKGVYEVPAHSKNIAFPQIDNHISTSVVQVVG